MQILTNEQTQQVAGGWRLELIKWIVQEVFMSALGDMVTGSMQALGERENRPVGTRP